MDSAPILDLLILARAFVEAGWTQYRFAGRMNGPACSPFDDEAEVFCLISALVRARFELEASGSHYETVLAVVRRARGLHPCPKFSRAARESSLVAFNDHPETKKADVLALFDAACERVGGK